MVWKIEKFLLEHTLLVSFFLTLLAAVAVSAADEPNWVSRAKAGETYWVENHAILGVGMSQNIGNFSLKRTVAENRARAAILKAVGLQSATLRGSEILEIWQMADGTIYALARVPESGIEP